MKKYVIKLTKGTDVFRIEILASEAILDTILDDLQARGYGIQIIQTIEHLT